MILTHPLREHRKSIRSAEITRSNSDNDSSEDSSEKSSKSGVDS